MHEREQIGEQRSRRAIDVVEPPPQLVGERPGLVGAGAGVVDDHARGEELEAGRVQGSEQLLGALAGGGQRGERGVHVSARARVLDGQQLGPQQGMRGARGQGRRVGALEREPSGLPATTGEVQQAAADLEGVVEQGRAGTPALADLLDGGLELLEVVGVEPAQQLDQRRAWIVVGAGGGLGVAWV